MRRLERAERHGQVEVGSGAQTAPLSLVDAARQIAGDAHARARPASRKDVSRQRFKPALQSGSEQGVDQNGAATVPPKRSTSPSHVPSPFAASLRLAERGHPHRDPALGEMPRGDIAIAAIIARPAQDQHRLRAGETVASPRPAPPRPAPSTSRPRSRRRSPPARRRASLRRSGSGARSWARVLAQAVARRHHSRGHAASARSRAASRRTRRSRSRPLPDMRTKLAPRPAPAARRARLRSAAPARSPAPRDRCAFPPSPSGPRSTPSQPANTSAVESATRGLTSSTGVRRSAKVDRLSSSPRPVAAHRQAEQAGRHVAPSAAATAIACAGSMRPTARSATAAPPPASAEPPPIPAATGSRLSRRSAAPCAAPARLCSASAARITRLSLGRARRERPAMVSDKLVRRLGAQPVAIGRKKRRRSRSHGVRRAAPADMQREIELGRRDFAPAPRQGAAFAGVSPVSILASDPPADIVLGGEQRRLPREARLVAPARA